MPQLKTLILACAVATPLVGAASASRAAVVVPWDGWVAPLPQTPGAGLEASMWNGLFSSLTNADAYASSHARDARFHATVIDYPNGDMDALNNPANHAAFVGADLSSSTAPGTANAHNMVYRFAGYIAIPAAGDVNFVVGSSDGMQLAIGGVPVIAYEAPNGYYFRNEIAHFSRAGLYPIEVTYFSDWSGVTGIELHSNLPGGLGFGPSGTTGIVPSGALYTTIVPTPGAGALLGLGLLVAGRRRRLVR